MSPMPLCRRASYSLPATASGHPEQPQDNRNCPKTNPQNAVDFVNRGVSIGHRQDDDSEHDGSQSRQQRQQSDDSDDRNHVTQSTVPAAGSYHRQHNRNQETAERPDSRIQRGFG